MGSSNTYICLRFLKYVDEHLVSYGIGILDSVKNIPIPSAQIKLKLLTG